MKRLKYIIIWCVVLTLCTSCGGDSGGGSSGIPSGPVNPTPTSIAVTGVSISKTTLVLVEGESETLSASVAPSNATNKKFSWSSSKTSVAAVDDNGKVTAVAAGTATITVMTADGNKTATCTVTVEAAAIPVTGVSFDKPTASLTVGEDLTLKVTIKPEEASNKKVSWSSDKTSVVTVDDNGKVTAIAPGTATITVTTADGNMKATCTITVKEAKVAVTGVKLNKSTTQLTVGGTETLTATVNPSNASNKKVSWSSSNTSVAKVDANGKVTAVAAGTATITVKTADGNKIATCIITVANSGPTDKQGGATHEGYNEVNIPVS